jgi:hypothetical protein
MIVGSNLWAFAKRWILSTLSAILLFLLGSLLTHWFSKARDRKKSFRDACAQFRSAFSETLAELDAPKDIHFVMSRSTAKHDAAIDEFRRHVPRRKLKDFDAACARYCEQRKADPAILQVYRARRSGRVDETIQNDHAHRASLVAAIRELVDFAKPRV